MNILVREATLSDAQDISRLNKEALGYDYPSEETAKKLRIILNSSHDKIYVAVIGDVVVGYIHAADYDVLYFPTMKNIMGIAVDGNYRRLGIGNRLICAVEDWAKATCASGIRLNSGITRKEAHAFYRSCGFDGEKGQLRFIKAL